MEQSLAALDRPLGEKKARAPAPAATAGEKKAAPARKEVDPLVAAKLAEDEEKKRKRAERFGGPEVSAPAVGRARRRARADP